MCAYHILAVGLCPSLLSRIEPKVATRVPLIPSIQIFWRDAPIEENINHNRHSSAIPQNKHLTHHLGLIGGNHNNASNNWPARYLVCKSQLLKQKQNRLNKAPTVSYRTEAQSSWQSQAYWTRTWNIRQGLNILSTSSDCYSPTPSIAIINWIINNINGIDKISILLFLHEYCLLELVSFPLKCIANALHHQMLNWLALVSWVVPF